jgi:hypothetical protein
VITKHIIAFWKIILQMALSSGEGAVGKYGRADVTFLENTKKDLTSHGNIRQYKIQLSVCSDVLAAAIDTAFGRNIAAVTAKHK